ncbi:hypothetical protein HAX54_031296 [Datura stramonium]|uniref:Uncharacterized protein n=1 Tax=Datura stramonium TaxID=4076 RepID=A0ABS8VB24_DATST|nr:hypothetical protein [Datura stramonium]
MPNPFREMQVMTVYIDAGWLMAHGLIMVAIMTVWPWFRESPVVSQYIDLPNTARWASLPMYQRFHGSVSTFLPVWHDTMYSADVVITLATNTRADAPAMKRAKSTMSKTQPPPSASSTTSTAQFHPAIGPAPTP